jgi:hypothetical protein
MGMYMEQSPRLMNMDHLARFATMMRGDVSWDRRRWLMLR